MFLVKLGLTVPKCKPVLRRPLKSPPITPLMLRMDGYIMRTHEAKEKTSENITSMEPATSPPTSNERAKRDCLRVPMNRVVERVSWKELSIGSPACVWLVLWTILVTSFQLCSPPVESAAS